VIHSKLTICTGWFSARASLRFRSRYKGERSTTTTSGIHLATTDYSLERGLPSSIEAERSILGAILLDDFAYTQAASQNLQPEDFSLDSHRRIYARIHDLREVGHPVDLVTLAEELSRHKEVEAVGGVAYLSSLTDGLPHRANIEQYVRIVKDKALLRGLIFAANAAIARAMDEADPADEVLNAAEAALYELSENRFTRDFQDVKQIVRDSFGSIDALYERGQRITGLETHFSDFDGMTSGLQRSDLVIIAAPPWARPHWRSTWPKMQRWTAKWWACFPWKCRARRCCSACCVPTRASTRTSCAWVS
jgi:replicative DNA helicase